MQNTTLAALAASLRVIGDEMLTIAETLKADATAAPLAQDAQQAFAQSPQQPPQYQQQAPAQSPQQPPQYQQQAPAQSPQQPPQYQQQAPAQSPQQPPQYQQQAPAQGQAQVGGMEAPAVPTSPPPTSDEFTAFSNEVIALGRQAGPQGLTPIMGNMLSRYAGPPTHDLQTVPAAAYGAFIEEVRAYVAQQQGGGGQQ